MYGSWYSIHEPWSELTDTNKNVSVFGHCVSLDTGKSFTNDEDLAWTRILAHCVLSKKVPGCAFPVRVRCFVEWRAGVDKLSKRLRIYSNVAESRMSFPRFWDSLHTGSFKTSVTVEIFAWKLDLINKQRYCGNKLKFQTENRSSILAFSFRWGSARDMLVKFVWKTSVLVKNNTQLAALISKISVICQGSFHLPLKRCINAV